MPKRKQSHKAKIAGLVREAAKHERALDRIHGQIEVAEAAEAGMIERELAKVERRLGVSLARGSGGKKTAKKATKKKATKKRSAQKRSAKRARAVEVQMPTSRKKRTKKAAKKAGKRSSKGSSRKKRSKAAFNIDVIEGRKVIWSGPLGDYLADNQDDLDEVTLAKIKALKPGAAVSVDMGAGGRHRLRRKK